MQDTDTTHYKFTRWSGDDLAYVKLIDGKAFDVFKETEQAIKMPDRNITIQALYDVSYLFTINGVEQGYYLEGEKIQVSAEEIEGKTFRYWSGNTECIDNKYNPNIVVTMPEGPVNIIPVYSNTNDRNNIGFVLTDVYNNDTIKTEDINVISGEVSKGFMFTDVNGHIYIITSVVDSNCNIMRLTKTQGGDEDGQ